jgi:hypothetical protein
MWPLSTNRFVNFVVWTCRIDTIGGCVWSSFNNIVVEWLNCFTSRVCGRINSKQTDFIFRSHLSPKAKRLIQSKIIWYLRKFLRTIKLYLCRSSFNSNLSKLQNITDTLFGVKISRKKWSKNPKKRKLNSVLPIFQQLSKNSKRNQCSQENNEKSYRLIISRDRRTSDMQFCLISNLKSKNRQNQWQNSGKSGRWLSQRRENYYGPSL